MRTMDKARSVGRSGVLLPPAEMLLGSLGIVATHIGDSSAWAGRRTSIVAQRYASFGSTPHGYFVLKKVKL